MFPAADIVSRKKSHCRFFKLMRSESSSPFPCYLAQRSMCIYRPHAARPTDGETIPKSERICSASQRSHSSAERSAITSAVGLSRPNPNCSARTDVSAKRAAHRQYGLTRCGEVPPRRKSHAPASRPQNQRAFCSHPSGKKEHSTSSHQFLNYRPSLVHKPQAYSEHSVQEQHLK